MMLYCVTWYPGYHSFSSARSGAYLVVFFSALTSRFSMHFPILPNTSLLLLSRMVASILFAVTKLRSAFRGTFQYAVIHRLEIDSGIPTFLSFYQIKDLSTSKNWIFSELLWRSRYLVCQDVLHALWSFATQSTPIVSSSGRSRFPAVEYPCW